MYHTGKWSATAVGDVGHGACDGTGDGDSSEEGNYDIGYSLTKKFGVGVSAGAGDAVCDGSGEQGLDGAKHCDGESRWEEGVDGGHVEG